MALLGDPASYHYGKDLSVRNPFVAPDGGAVADYPKGWRFLPSATKEQHEKLKKNSAVANAMHMLHNLSSVPSTRQYGRDPQAPERHRQETEKYQKVIATAHHNLVIAPQIQAEKEQKEREEEEQRQTIATLKMRVHELEKPIEKPIEKPTTPPVTSSATSYLPLAVVGIVIVVILLFLRRRA